MVDGEEWKGDNDNLYPPLFGYQISFTPPTPEQKAAEERRQAEALAKAEILFAALPLFDRSRICVKCRDPREPKTRHCKTGIQSGYNYAGGCKGETAEHEHFHRTCKLCRYEWLERCLGEE